MILGVKIYDRSVIVGLVAVLMVAGLTYSKPSLANSADSLAHYSFDEPVSSASFKDSSKNKDVGVCESGKCPESGYPGILNSSIWFDGASYINLGEFLGGNNFSVSLWVNPESTKNGQAFVGRHKTNGDNLFLFGIWDNGYHVRLRGSTVTFGPVLTGWHHLVASVKAVGNGSTISLYRDGTLLGKKNVPDIMGNLAGRPWVVGQEWDGDKTSDFYRGTMDELEIFSKELSAEEVQSIYKEYKAGLLGFNTMALGQSFTCLKVVGDRALCFGLNEHGQLGNGSTALEVATPVDVKLGPTERVKGFAAGMYHACALLESGKVKCWGINLQGQLGVGDSSIKKSSVPLEVTGLENVLAIAAGGEHTCAIVRNGYVSGMVKCWGKNNEGQLGDGTMLNSFSPVNVKYMLSGLILGLGTEHSCLVTQDNALYCWGDNHFAQLGDMTKITKSTPVLSKSIPSKTKVFGVSAGAGFTCVITSEKEHTECWGNNDKGQAISKDWIDIKDFPYSSVPSSVGSLGDLPPVELSSGNDYTCALLPQKNIRCWGGNDSGQLGDGLTKSSPLPVEVSNITTAEDVKTGYSHACARIEGGGVKCWGDGTSGQLGWPKDSKKLTINLNKLKEGEPDTYCASKPVDVPASLLCPEGYWWYDNKCKLNVVASEIVWTGLVGVINAQKTIEELWKVDRQKMLEFHKKLVDLILASEKEDAEVYKEFAEKLDEVVETVLEKGGSSQQPSGKTLEAQLAKVKQTLQEKATIFEELQGLYVQWLQKTKGSKQLDMSLDTAVNEAQAIYLSALFTGFVDRSLSADGCDDIIGKERLLDYLRMVTDPQRGPIELLKLLNGMQCLSNGLLMHVDQGLAKAYVFANAVIDEDLKDGSYHKGLKTEIDRSLMPVWIAIYDRLKYLVEIPSSKIPQEYLTNLNTQAGNEAIHYYPRYMYLFDKGNKEYQSITLCTSELSDDSSFAQSLPEIEKGDGGKTPDGVLLSQIEKVSCGAGAVMWEVEQKLNSQETCVDWRRFLNVALNPVLRGTGRCSLWQTARIGKGCCNKP